MLMPSLVETLLRGERFAMTSGEQARHFQYVDDVCALVECCLADDAPAGTFNASGGRELSIRDAVWTVARAISSDASALLDIGALPYRRDEQMRCVPGARDLGLGAQGRLRDGCRVGGGGRSTMQPRRSASAASRGQARGTVALDDICL